MCKGEYIVNDAKVLYDAALKLYLQNTEESLTEAVGFVVIVSSIMINLGEYAGANSSAHFSVLSSLLDIIKLAALFEI